MKGLRGGERPGSAAWLEAGECWGLGEGQFAGWLAQQVSGEQEALEGFVGRGGSTVRSWADSAEASE